MYESPSERLIGRLSVDLEILTQDQVEEALRQRQEEGLHWNFGEYLVAKGALSPQDLLRLERIGADRLERQAASHSGVCYRPGIALEELLQQAAAMHANDLHLHSGARLKVRIGGLLGDASDEPVSAEEAERMIYGLLDDEQGAELTESRQVDFLHSIPGVGRFRANAYRQHLGFDAVFRPIPTEPPTLSDLGLPDSLEQVTRYHQGLVLLTGPAGCGKSSTMAALIDLINRNRRGHIIVIEDPIEYVYRSRKCIVTQRQVGSHTETFPRALRAALREDPDVIVIGELRDLETVSLALTAAETGHLVLGTLHTNSAVRTINRVLGVYPADQQEQVRLMLSESLAAIVSQHLVQRLDGQGRVPALEMLFNTKAIGNLIRDKKTFQIPSAIQTGFAQGMVLLDQSLANLVRDGVVSKEEAGLHAEDPGKMA